MTNVKLNFTLYLFEKKIWQCIFNKKQILTKKYIMIKYLKSEKDWLTNSFYYAMFSLFFFFFMMPKLLTMLIIACNITNQELVVTMMVIPHQLGMLILLLSIIFISDKHINFREKLKLINWNNNFIWKVIVLELILVVIIPIVTLIFTFFLQYILRIEVNEPDINKLIMSTSYYGFAIIAIAAIIVAPLTEELVFRRVIFSFTKEKTSMIFATVFTSLIFAAIHGSLVKLPGLFILGLTMQMLYSYHNSLIISILFHALHNSVAMSMGLLLKYLIDSGILKLTDL